MKKHACGMIRVLVRGSIQLVSAGLILLNTPSLQAQSPLPVTVGAGLQSSFVHMEPSGGVSSDRFLVNSARIYVSGPVMENVKFMFNTEYNGVTSTIGVMDAAARFEFSPKMNFWAGRFLPPSDRSNLYGPYYSHHWAVYSDGIQDGYPFVAVGRDNGMVYWGDFGKVKVAGGGFDGASATGNSKILGAARVQVDFWDKESGYYLNGTYYGGKDLLAIGAAIQGQSGNTAASFDFLMEKKLSDGSVVSIESEYANYDKLGGYDSGYASSEGAYILGSYLFPKTVGVGKFEILGKYAEAHFRKSVGVNPAYDQKTTEVNFNYVMKEFNSRLMIFFINTDFNAVKTDFWQSGLGIQIQM
ncbi:MAG TPA: hypothetical protein VFY29_11160 [Terriglobia bacterium]|nr:hypothetical protein [Terriglobia bacterium]